MDDLVLSTPSSTADKHWSTRQLSWQSHLHPFIHRLPRYVTTAITALTHVITDNCCYWLKGDSGTEQRPLTWMSHSRDCDSDREPAASVRQLKTDSRSQHVFHSLCTADGATDRQRCLIWKWAANSLPLRVRAKVPPHATKHCPLKQRETWGDTSLQSGSGATPQLPNDSDGSRACQNAPKLKQSY